MESPLMGGPPPPPSPDDEPPLPRDRLAGLQKGNSVCSRSYFVVVMVFVHVYILNVIALLLYVYYSNGQPGSDGDTGGPATDTPATTGGQDTADVIYNHLSRLEGIKVGQKQRIELVPNKIQHMETLSLKPLLFDLPTTM